MPEVCCSKCQSTKIVPRARVVDQGHHNSEYDLAAVVYEDPDAWIFKGTNRASLFARVCAECGFTELYADYAKELYEAHLKAEQQSGGA